MKLPPLASLWANYPALPAEAVKARIGGEVQAEWITNACVLRVSHALNVVGYRIPRHFPGLRTPSLTYSSGARNENGRLARGLR
jgi:hypothetical protein